MSIEAVRSYDVPWFGEVVIMHDPEEGVLGKYYATSVNGLKAFVRHCTSLEGVELKVESYLSKQMSDRLGELKSEISELEKIDFGEGGNKKGWLKSFNTEEVKASEEKE